MNNLNNQLATTSASNSTTNNQDELKDSSLTSQTPQNDRPVFLSARCVRELTGLSESTIRRLRVGGDFPEPIRLTPSVAGHLRWYESEILEWLKSRRRA